MPGVHTFYDGSTLLSPIASVVNIEIDKVIFTSLRDFFY